MPSKSSSLNSATSGSAYSAATGRDPSVAASSAAPSRPATQRSSLPSSGHPLASRSDTLGGRASESRFAQPETVVASVASRSQGGVDLSLSRRTRFAAPSAAGSWRSSLGSGGTANVPAPSQTTSLSITLPAAPSETRSAAPMSVRTRRPESSWRDSMRAGADSTPGSGAVGSRQQEMGDLHSTPAGGSITSAVEPRGSDHPLATLRSMPGGRATESRRFRIESVVQSVVPSYGNSGSDHPPSLSQVRTSLGEGGSGIAAGSGGVETGTERAVRWRDQSRSAVSRAITAVTGRDPLVTGSVSVPSRQQEPRQAERTAEGALSRRQDSYLRSNAGSEYSLGRLTYLSLAGPGDEAEVAAMTEHTRPCIDHGKQPARASPRSGFAAVARGLHGGEPPVADGARVGAERSHRPLASCVRVCPWAAVSRTVRAAVTTPATKVPVSRQRPLRPTHDRAMCPGSANGLATACAPEARGRRPRSAHWRLSTGSARSKNSPAGTVPPRSAQIRWPPLRRVQERLASAAGPASALFQRAAGRALGGEPWRCVRVHDTASARSPLKTNLPRGCRVAAQSLPCVDRWFDDRWVPHLTATRHHGLRSFALQPFHLVTFRFCDR